MLTAEDPKINMSQIRSIWEWGHLTLRITDPAPVALRYKITAQSRDSVHPLVRHYSHILCDIHSSMSCRRSSGILIHRVSSASVKSVFWGSTVLMICRNQSK